MSALSISSPFPIFTDIDGQPLENGYIFIGVANLGPIGNPINVYWDAALTVPATQPIRTLGGYPVNNGTPARLYVNSDYSIQVQNKNGSVVYSSPVDTERFGGGIVNASQVVYDPAGTGAVATTVQTKLRESVSVKDFGAVGDGVADDTVALTAFFNAVSNKTGYINPGTYKITSLIYPTLSNCRIYGVPGASIITGSFGYALIRLGAVDSVEIDGLSFTTTYVNAVEDTGASVVYSYQQNVKNLAITNCRFSSATANTSAFSVYARINAGDTSAVIDGLTVQNCSFINVGRIACTLMNRGTAADKYTAARRVRFVDNYAYNLGTQGSYGFLISLDGYGSDAEVSRNNLNKCLGIGIENVGWIASRFIGNTFADFSSSYAPMSWSGSNAMTDCVVKDNLCLDTATVRSNFQNVSNSTFSNNHWKTSSATDAAVLIYGSNNRFNDEIYDSAGNYACVVGTSTTTSQNNVFSNCSFSTSSSSVNFSVLRFVGSNTKWNQIKGAKITKGTGGVLFDQITSASENVIWDYFGTTIDLGYGAVVVNIPDSNYTLTGDPALLAYDMLRFNGTLTAGRTIDMPKSIFVKPKTFWNTSGQTLTFTVNGVGTSTLANSGVATAFFDTASNSIRVI